MSFATLRPSSTDSVSGTLTGGATAHAVLADDSDSSYVSLNSLYDEDFTVGLQDLTLPAGAIIARVAVRLRIKATGGSWYCQVATDHVSTGVLTLIGTTYVTWSTATTVLIGSDTTGPFSDGGVDAASLFVRVAGGSGAPGGALVVHEAQLDVSYVTQPVAVVSSPTGTLTTTNTPQVEWANTFDSYGAGSDRQAAFEVKFYTAAEYGGGGFDPDTTTVTTTQSGVTTGAATTWTPTATLADGTYRAYVRVAQTVNGSYHWSDWDYEGFVIDVLLPAVPDLVLYPDTDDACIHIMVDGQSGDATTDALELQRSTDGGVTWEPVRLPVGP